MDGFRIGIPQDHNGICSHCIFSLERVSDISNRKAAAEEYNNRIQGFQEEWSMSQRYTPSVLPIPQAGSRPYLRIRQCDRDPIR
jgi:hypothetical protein